MTSVYEIRDRDGRVVCSSSIERCGYSPALIRSMVEAGYQYYVNGKSRKF